MLNQLACRIWRFKTPQNKRLSFGILFGIWKSKNLKKGKVDNFQIETFDSMAISESEIPNVQQADW